MVDQNLRKKISTDGVMKFLNMENINMTPPPSLLKWIEYCQNSSEELRMKSQKQTKKDK